MMYIKAISIVIIYECKELFTTFLFSLQRESPQVVEAPGGGGLQPDESQHPGDLYTKLRD